MLLYCCVYADPIKIVLWVTSTRIYTSVGIDSKYYYYYLPLIIHYISSHLYQRTKYGNVLSLSLLTKLPIAIVTQRNVFAYIFNTKLLFHYFTSKQIVST